MDMRKVIDVYAAGNEHVDQGLLTLFMRSDIQGLYEWKENKQTTWFVHPSCSYEGIKSIFVVLWMTVEKSA